jgi:hypothetical protein
LCQQALRLRVVEFQHLYPKDITGLSTRLIHNLLAERSWRPGKRRNISQSRITESPAMNPQPGFAGYGTV